LCHLRGGRAECGGGVCVGARKWKSQNETATHCNTMQYSQCPKEKKSKWKSTFDAVMGNFPDISRIWETYIHATRPMEKSADAEETCEMCIFLYINIYIHIRHVWVYTYKDPSTCKNSADSRETRHMYTFKCIYICKYT